MLRSPALCLRISRSPETPLGSRGARAAEEGRGGSRSGRITSSPPPGRGPPAWHRCRDGAHLPRRAGEVLDEEKPSNLGDVVGEHAPAAPGLSGGDAVDAAAGPAVVAFEMGDPRLRTGPPPHELGERAASLDGQARSAGT